MNNGARAASRWATIEASLNTGGGHCESGVATNSIVGQVTKSANIVPVNPSQLCAKVIPGSPPGFSATELVQPYNANQANIVVDVWPNLTNPECITVNITYTTPALGPFPTLVMQAHQQRPDSHRDTGEHVPGAHQGQLRTS